jgi:Zn-dependent protease with chaperone function
MIELLYYLFDKKPKVLFLLSLIITFCFSLIYVFTFQGLNDITIGPNYWYLANRFGKITLFIALALNIVCALSWFLNYLSQKRETESLGDVSK